MEVCLHPLVEFTPSDDAIEAFEGKRQQTQKPWWKLGEVFDLDLASPRARQQGQQTKGHLVRPESM